MAVEADRLKPYKMDHASRGAALIFSNHRFYPGLNKEDLPSNENDATIVEAMFKRMSFDTTTFHNKTEADMCSAIQNGNYVFYFHYYIYVLLLFETHHNDTN